MLTRSKLRSIESKISEALINNEISHEDFTAIVNEEESYRKPKESIEWWKSKELILKIFFVLIEEGKRKSIDQIIWQNGWG